MGSEPPDTVTTTGSQITGAVRVQRQVYTYSGLALCVRVGDQLAAVSTRERSQQVNFFHLTMALNRS